MSFLNFLGEIKKFSKKVSIFFYGGFGNFCQKSSALLEWSSSSPLDFVNFQSLHTIFCKWAYLFLIMYFQFNNWIPAAKTNWMWNIYRRCENKKCFLLQFNIDRNFDAFHRLRQSTFFKDIGRQISIEFRNVLSLVSHIVFAKKTRYVLHASTMWTINLCHLLKVMGIR